MAIESVKNYMWTLFPRLDSTSSKYENFIWLYDFNSCVGDSSMKTFGEIYKLQNLIKDPTCFKNPENLACIDLILTNKPLSFKNTYVIETGLSDFHKMIVAVMKMHFPKMKPQVVSYRKYKDFQNETFLDSLRHELKGAFSSLRQHLITESPLKMMKKCFFISP